MNTTSTTAAKNYYAGLTLGEIVCDDCAGHILKLRIAYRPGDTHFDGAQDTYERLNSTDIACLQDELGTSTLCYC